MQDLVYLARGNGEIDRITPDGTSTPVATGLGFCDSIVFDRSGNLFVAVRTGHINQDSLLKITPTGAVSTFVSGLDNLAGIGLDPATGDLYVSSELPARITRITPQGVAIPYASVPSEAEGVAVDSHGNVFVSTFNATIYKIAPGGTSVSLFASLDSLLGSADLAIDASDTLFASAGRVWKITPDGSASVWFDPYPNSFTFGGLALDSGGDLLVESDHDAVLDIAPSRQYSVFTTSRAILDVATINATNLPEPATTGAVFVMGAAIALTRRNRFRAQ